MTIVKVKQSVLAEMIKRSVEKAILKEDFGQEPQMQAPQAQQPKQQRDLRNSKIKRLVDHINTLINTANNIDGFEGVIDNTNTWESPMVFEPIKYDLNGALTIINTYPMEPKRGKDVEKILRKNIDYDGEKQLLDIRKWYLKTLKQISNQASVIPNVE